MHRYEAGITWKRDGQKFTDNKYSRGHEWSFDGGVTVPASSSPLIVREPYSVAEAVDPEEALVAAASSCHMLAFLYFAAKGGFVVENYEDHPVGEMDRNPQGKTAFTRIILRPKIEFSSDHTPSSSELDALHHAAHDECYIANSIKCDVVVESPAAVA